MNKEIGKLNDRFKKTIGWVALFIISLVLLLAGPVSHAWHAQEKDRIRDGIEAALDTAIVKEKMLHQKWVSMEYDADQSPDKGVISLDEKMNYMDQVYLSQRDPNRHCLDSLYDAELKQRGLTCVSAIRYNLGDSLKGASCSPNELKTMELVKQYSFRVSTEKPPFVLQAYVQTPNLNAGGWHPYFFFSLGAFGMLFSLYLFLKERKRLLAIVSTNQDTTNSWTRPSPSIWYDEQFATIKNLKSGKEKTLHGLCKTLCIAFLKNEHHIVTYEEIAEIQGYSTKALSEKDLNRVHKAIKPLKEQLSSLDIEIRNIQKTGYRMIFPDEKEE